MHARDAAPPPAEQTFVHPKAHTHNVTAALAFQMPLRGELMRCSMVPSSVSSSRPLVSLSRRPTGARKGRRRPYLRGATACGAWLAEQGGELQGSWRGACAKMRQVEGAQGCAPVREQVVDRVVLYVLVIRGGHYVPCTSTTADATGSCAWMVARAAAAAAGVATDASLRPGQPATWGPCSPVGLCSSTAIGEGGSSSCPSSTTSSQQTFSPTCRAQARARGHALLRVWEVLHR